MTASVTTLQGPSLFGAAPAGDREAPLDRLGPVDSGLPSGNVSFETNEGQAPGDVAFVVRSDSASTGIMKDGALSMPSPAGEIVLRPVGAGGPLGSPDTSLPRHRVNYLTGNDPSKWRTGIQAYGKVTFPQIFPGTDLVYRDSQGDLEYDFVLAPHADPGRIAMEFEGATSLEVTRDGQLIVHSPDGAFRQTAPLAYQPTLGRREVGVRYELQGGTRFSFALDDYDPTQRLVIDPVLKFSTLLGGSQGDDILAVDTAADGVVVVGSTTSSDFPTENAMDDTLGGTEDVVVSKVSPNGRDLLWSTYIGGAEHDEANDVRLDASGRPFVAGSTSSDDFPTAGAGGPYDDSLAGTNQDAFFLVLSSDGQSLDYSTYLGGAFPDTGFAIAVDDGAAVIAGITSSDDFPLKDQYQDWQGSSDFFVTRIDPSIAGAGGLTYSSHFGGTAIDTVPRGALSVDDGIAYVGGASSSIDFPITDDASDETKAASSDGVVLIVDPTQDGDASLVHATWVGGDGGESVQGLVVDDNGHIVATGWTNSSDLATTNKAYQREPQGGEDAFVLKLKAPGREKAFLTHVGGSDDDDPTDVALDAAKNIYLTGATESQDYPLSIDTISKLQVDNEDSFVTKLNKVGRRILWSSALPGTGRDSPEGIAVRGTNVYVAGYANDEIRTTPNAFQTTPGDEDLFTSDGFIVRLKPSKFHARKAKIELSKHLKAEGTITVPSGFNLCKKKVPVQLQRKKGAEFKKVKSLKTDVRGKLSVMLSDKAGTYRLWAKPLKRQGTKHICKAATSKAVRHRH